MGSQSYWLKPLMIILALFAFIVLLLEGLPQAFPDVPWSEINSTVIAIMPWLVAFGLGIFVLYYVAGRK